MPRSPLPISAVYNASAITLLVTFDRPITVVDEFPALWSAIIDDLEYAEEVVGQSGVNAVLIDMSEDVPNPGPDSVTYAGPSPALIDGAGNEVAGFVGFPVTQDLKLLSATFSSSTGDTVLTFSNEIVLCDSSKKPWDVEAENSIQSVQAVLQDSPTSIRLLTNTNGPAGVNDFVSYDSSSGCLERPSGARVGTVAEFPLTIIA